MVSRENKRKCGRFKIVVFYFTKGYLFSNRLVHQIDARTRQRETDERSCQVAAAEATAEIGTETETEKEDEVEVVIAIVPEGELKSTEDAKIAETGIERKGEVEAQARKGETKIGKDEAEAEIKTEKESEAEIATILEEEGAKRKREAGGKIVHAADK